MEVSPYAGEHEQVPESLLARAGEVIEQNADVRGGSNFDRTFFDGAGKPWICPLKAAYRMYPDAPSHKNQTLRYLFRLKLDDAFAMPPHRAGPDAYVTAHILADEPVAKPPATLIEWTRGPTLLPGQIKFGKHRGTKWGEIPLDYLEWLSREANDPDVKYTAGHYGAKLEIG